MISIAKAAPYRKRKTQRQTQCQDVVVVPVILPDKAHALFRACFRLIGYSYRSWWAAHSTSIIMLLRARYPILSLRCYNEILTPPFCYTCSYVLLRINHYFSTLPDIKTTQFLINNTCTSSSSSSNLFGSLYRQVHIVHMV